ncbi:hypothetical protein GLAREA_12344 [Glarea lozoyensis ATCC 20868]|uniref:Uncharacterized protein n=1 Tax=Glarea lozoyensis (strain ATCC 20868 / MF5171) TaxID=1116229 RepID=S3DZ15_GLAL2|nr:uncharacterized protein GLAREA_12344 [Glarea lozoyensis ATCC 20868]EPE31588.1 hypothetical protein GLAREA_12344 [Glarea lozoyensis ATCC 20868]
MSQSPPAQSSRSLSPKSSRSLTPQSHTAPTIEVAGTSQTSSHLRNRNRKIIIASDWWIHNEGVIDVEARFEKLCHEQEQQVIPTASCQWRPGKQCFLLSCPPVHSKVVPQLFMQALQGLIREEEEKNGIYGQQNQRQNHTSESDSESDSDDEPSIDASEFSDEYVAENGDNKPMVSSKIQRLPEYLERYNQATNHDDDTASFSKHQYPIEILSMNENCVIVKSLNENVVYVGSTSEESIHLAILKLDNLAKYALPSQYISHSFYTEDTGNYELSLKHLYDVKIAKKRMFETTLIDDLDKLYDIHNSEHNLEKFITVRCAIHNSEQGSFAAVKNKVTIVNKEPNFGETRICWEGFSCASKESPNSLRHFEDIERAIAALQRGNKVPPTTKVEQVEFVDSTKVKTIENWKKKAQKEGAHRLITQPMANKAQRESWDICMGSDKPNFDNVPGRAFDRQTPVQLVSGLNRRLPMVQPQQQPHQQQQQQQQQRPSGVSVPMGAPAGTNPTFAQKLRNANAQKVSLEPDQWPTLVSSKLEVDVKPKQLEPEKLEPKQLTKQRPETPPNLLDDDVPMLGGIDAELMAFTSPPSGNDRLQSSSEIQTRVFHQTMQQKKPKPKKERSLFANRLELPDNLPLSRPQSDHIDPLPAFSKELNSNFMELLTGARGFRGDVKLQARFGRILLRGIKGLHIAEKENKDFSKPEGDLQRILNPTYPGARRPTTSFTNTLTTVPADIDGLLQLKEDGRSLWKNDSEWRIFYTFTFIEAATRLPFVIEIDAEKFTTRSTSQQSFGQLNVHGTKRVWDFQISLTGTKEEDRYGDLATKLQKTLHIPSNQESPKLYAEIDRDLEEKYTLQEIYLHKVNLHRSSNNRSVLSISEVLAFITNICSPPGKPDVRIIRATYYNGPGSGFNYRWFTASIESVRGNELLVQNKKLELGEEAGWTPETFADVLPDLSIPACQMLKQMDHVGYYNENGIRRSPPPTQTSPPKPVERYW